MLEYLTTEFVLAISVISLGIVGIVVAIVAIFYNNMRLVDRGLAISLILFVLILFLIGTLDFSKKLFCRDKVYQLAHYKEGVEPGYLKCCRTNYVDHRAVKECEIFKEQNGDN